ncbi:MAG: HdeA family protein [Desulfobacterota bacterium]|nr:HdeA family protein [Thermodesulfobacteriota bacterium]
MLRAFIIVASIACFAVAGGDQCFAKDKKKKNKETSAQIVDMSKCTCQDMMNVNDEQLIKASLIWIDGYVSGKSGDTTVSLGELETLARNLESYCKSNPSTPILDAARRSKGR